MFARDAEIPGVLCRGSPLSGASRSTPPMQDCDSAIVGEPKTILRDIATTDCGLWLLRRQTEVEGSQLIVDRMRRSIQRGAGSSRNLLGTNRTPLSGHTDIAPRRSLHVEIAQDLSDFVADPEGLCLALLQLRRNASAAPHYDGQVVAKNSAPHPGASTRAVEIVVAGNGSGMTHEVLRSVRFKFHDEFGQRSGLGPGPGPAICPSERRRY